MGFAAPKLPSLRDANDAFIQHVARTQLCEYCGRGLRDSAGKAECVGCGAPVGKDCQSAPLPTSSYGTRTYRK